MATSDNIALLRKNRYEYIAGMRLLKDARALAVPNDPSVPDPEHFTVLKDNLSVHEVTSFGEGFHDDERIILCFNPERARSTMRRRDGKLRESADYHENTAALDKARMTDGICMLLTNSPTLSPEDIALGYRTLSEVERAFRDMKNVKRTTLKNLRKR